MKTAYVISDLHLFAPWTKAQKAEKVINSVLTMSDYFILNGDIFDFRWSVHHSHDVSAKKAVEWLENVISVNVKCDVHYILGNHDYHEALLPHLELLQEKYSNFHVHETHFMLGENLFMHGDLVFHQKSSPFKRLKYTHKNKQPAALRRLYDAAISKGAHKMLGYVYYKERCAREIEQRISKHAPDIRNKIRHIYFGHTHVAFSNYQFGDIVFHNTGALIKRLEWSIKKIEI